MTLTPSITKGNRPPIMIASESHSSQIGRRKYCKLSEKEFTECTKRSRDVVELLGKTPERHYQDRAQLWEEYCRLSRRRLTHRNLVLEDKVANCQEKLVASESCAYQIGMRFAEAEKMVTALRSKVCRFAEEKKELQVRVDQLNRIVSEKDDEIVHLRKRSRSLREDRDAQEKDIIAQTAKQRRFEECLKQEEEIFQQKKQHLLDQINALRSEATTNGVMHYAQVAQLTNENSSLRDRVKALELQVKLPSAKRK
ncbi:MAG: hypothetical protein LLG04_12510 [Parachlamydia sp.]|nr:hypothetical protein [Parachlamydia sp.]